MCVCCVFFLLVLLDHQKQEQLQKDWSSIIGRCQSFDEIHNIISQMTQSQFLCFVNQSVKSSKHNKWLKLEKAVLIIIMQSLRPKTWTQDITQIFKKHIDADSQIQWMINYIKCKFIDYHNDKKPTSAFWLKIDKKHLMKPLMIFLVNVCLNEHCKVRQILKNSFVCCNHDCNHTFVIIVCLLCGCLKFNTNL